MPDEVSDGALCLNLQVADFQLDAVPSRPVLIPLSSAARFMNDFDTPRIRGSATPRIRCDRCASSFIFRRRRRTAQGVSRRQLAGTAAETDERYVQAELENGRRWGGRALSPAIIPGCRTTSSWPSRWPASWAQCPSEVVVMNSLTVNLHLMMATFYRPAGQRNKVLLETGAFPSDHFAIESHLTHRGIDPADGMLLVGGRRSDSWKRHDICATIDRHADDWRLSCCPVCSTTPGNCSSCPQITAAAHRHAIPVGFDLAHAAGNVPLALHDWDVDFAVWCTYKYLNSGPGSLGGCYIHQRHAADAKRRGWPAGGARTKQHDFK